MATSLEIYKEYRKKIKALQYANFLINWDHETGTSEQSILSNAEYMGALSTFDYDLTTNVEFENVVEDLYNNREKLDIVTKHEIEVMRKKIADTKKIPAKENADFAELISRSYPIYVKAKKENNFDLFCPYLEKIVAFCRNQTMWLATDSLKGYDVLLDQYEPHYTTKEYDKFFDALRERLVPFVKEVTAKKVTTPAFAKKFYSAEKQREFCEYLRDVMCFDKSRGVMKESEHPFTSGFGTDDVRITNHYYENNFVSSIFSCIHETGHAIYEQQCDKSLNETLSGGGASLGLHESQSRFYENMIGRSRAFWQVHYGKLVQTFPEQLAGVTLDDFVSYINTAERSFIRTEADELTYPLHIMLRYEIEKRIISGAVTVKELQKEWNRMFYEYFGIVPSMDSNGVLQDVHWAYGNFGYFPTYALGSAIAAQLYHYMEKDFDVASSLLSGNTKRINEWLRTHVHKYGASKYPDEILRQATGEEFNPNYYIDYLINKYSKE